MKGIARGFTLAVLLLTLFPAASAAQETPGQGSAATPRDAADPQEDVRSGEPEMAKAPLQFRLSGTVGAFFWGEKEGVVDLDNLVNFGIDIESRPAPAVAFRLRGSYGRTKASVDTASVDVNQWEFGVDIVGRVAVAPFTKAGVVPFGLIGAGTIALDPRDDPPDPDDKLVTRSQGAFSFGGGIDIEPRGSRWGGRVEYRRYSVSLEDPFNPVDRTGDTLGANLIMASIYWRL